MPLRIIHSIFKKHLKNISKTVVRGSLTINISVGLRNISGTQKERRTANLLIGDVSLKLSALER